MYGNQILLTVIIIDNVISIIMITRRMMIAAATQAVAIAQTTPKQTASPEVIRQFWEPLDRKMIGALNLKASDRVLDAGCGRGDHVRIFSEYCPVVGVDLKEASLDYAMKHVRNPGAKILKADLRKLPFEDRSFSFVWSSHVFHGVRDVHKMAAELKRVVRPGGSLAIRENRVMSSLMPVDIGLGEPGVEARADLAFTTYLAKDRINLGRFPYMWSEVLRNIGLQDIQVNSFLHEVRAPFTTVQESYFQHYLLRKSEADISQSDRELLRQIADPASSAYILKRPDLYFVSVSTVYRGRVQN